MDNVMNRPMFRRRDARDRLNDMAGVQGYNVGGGIVADPTGAIQRPFQQPSVRPAGLPSLTVPPMSRLSVAPLTRTEGATLGLNAPGLERATSEDLPRLSSFRDSIIRQIDSAVKGGDGEAIQLLQEQLSVVDDTIARVGQIPGAITSRGPLALEGSEAVVSQMSPEQLAQLDIFSKQGPLDRAADNVVPGAPPAPAPVRPGQTGFIRPEVSVPTGLPAAKPVEPTGPSGMEMEARKPLITDPAAVAAGLNDPDEGTRERTAADFMQEFMANAPKYEGGDKSMMKAMIGFAIAAGESPNAMSNIANGLQAGAQMFLQDKAAKDEFDRQLQLSAMQYGLGEVAKERELSRTGTSYVASKDMEYRGRKYGPGESVFVLNSDILNGRLPEGAVTEATNDALMNMNVALKEAAQKAYEEKTIDDEDYRATISTLDQAASDYSSSSNLMPLLEASLVRVANGEVTGVNSALTTAMNQAMNAVGLKPADQYESQEAYKADMEQVSVKLVQDLLGESGKTVSDADRQMVRDLLAIQQGVVSGTIKDPDILMRKIQEVMGALESKKQTALDTYRTYSEGYSGMLAPSGAPLRSLKAERVFNPPQSAQPFRYEIRDGIYTKVYGE